MAYMYLFKYFVRNLPTTSTCIKHWKVLNTQMKDLRSQTRKRLSSPDFKGNKEERKSSLNKNCAMHGWCFLAPKSNSVLIWCCELFGIIKTTKSESSLRQFDREQKSDGVDWKTQPKMGRLSKAHLVSFCRFEKGSRVFWCDSGLWGWQRSGSP